MLHYLVLEFSWLKCYMLVAIFMNVFVCLKDDSAFMTSVKSELVTNEYVQEHGHSHPMFQITTDYITTSRKLLPYMAIMHQRYKYAPYKTAPKQAQ